MKCTQFVLVGENLKLFSLHHTSSFFKHFCSPAKGKHLDIMDFVPLSLGADTVDQEV